MKEQVDKDDLTSPVTDITSLGRWYTEGRKINVRSDLVKKVKWPSGTLLAVLYDERLNELRIKPLQYR